MKSPEELGGKLLTFYEGGNEAQRCSATCPGTQGNYSPRAESEAPGVLVPRPAPPSTHVGHVPCRTAEGCELAPTAASPTPSLGFSESRAHRASLYQSFRATKPALFNTGFSYLGWRINSTIIKSIKHTKLDFFSGMAPSTSW